MCPELDNVIATLESMLLRRHESKKDKMESRQPQTAEQLYRAGWQMGGGRWLYNSEQTSCVQNTLIFHQSIFRAHLIQRDGGEDDEAFDDLLPERRHLQQHQAVVQHSDNEAAQNGAED
jgi:hypothetical protein